MTVRSVEFSVEIARKIRKDGGKRGGGDRFRLSGALPPRRASPCAPSPAGRGLGGGISFVLTGIEFLYITLSTMVIVRFNTVGIPPPNPLPCGRGLGGGRRGGGRRPSALH